MLPVCPVWTVDGREELPFPFPLLQRRDWKTCDDGSSLSTNETATRGIKDASASAGSMNDGTTGQFFAGLVAAVLRKVQDIRSGAGLGVELCGATPSRVPDFSILHYRVCPRRSQ